MRTNVCRAVLLAALAILPVVSAAPATAQDGPDLVLLNGRLFTADPLRPWAQAVAVEDGRIVAVGSDAELADAASAADRVVDVGGRVVVPGLNDAHWHVMPSHGSSPVSFAERDPSLEEVADTLAAAVRSLPPGTWITGDVGGLVLGDGVAARRMLDRVAPDHPVRLAGWTGHGIVLNGAAQRVWGIDATTPDPLGGWWERSDDGTPLVGHGYARFETDHRQIASRPDSSVVDALRTSAEHAASLGITTIQHMAMPLDASRTMRLARPLTLPVRLRVITMNAPFVTDAERPDVDDSMLYRSGVKWIVDGTPVERLAFLGAPYADRADWYGRPYVGPPVLRDVARAALEAGDQPMFHAGGDSAIALVFAALRDVAPDSTWRRLRPRIEHGDFIRPDQLEDARRLGVVVVQNPSHLMIPELIGARLGARAGRTQLLASLLRAGVPLAFGSDGPTNPFLNLMFATLHPGNPGEALSREQAVVAYTLGSAHAERADDKGMIAEGMVADLAVLSQDIFAVPAEALPATHAVMTVVDGRVVHEAR